MIKGSLALSVIYNNCKCIAPNYRATKIRKAKTDKWRDNSTIIAEGFKILLLVIDRK